MYVLFFFQLFLLIPLIFGAFPIERRASNYTVERNYATNYRLPTSLKPVHYDITLEPFFEPDFTFNGTTIITVEVIEQTSTVVFHGRDLTINQADVKIKAQNAIEYNPILGFDWDYATTFYTVTLRDPLRVGEIVDIEVDYTGILHNDNDGFYRGEYEENGEKKLFATTQFEANSARRAFPCFDEPALKATFVINMIRQQKYNSISNMDIEKTEQLGTNRFKDIFKKSVLMSTYLVAFIVSEMTSENLNNHRVYAPKYLIDDGRGRFSVQASVDILTALEDYTQIKYALDKMYQVAIPDSYFSAGAMENWGLVTYRETRLLYKESVTTSAEKQSILSIIAHEYAHQWFGNLVSPLWWSYLWLNEGFATYFGAYAVDLVMPSMRMMDQYVVSTVQYAFQSDALESTRPMTVVAETTSEVERLFDRVAYDKSGSVLRMMEHFVTSPVYKQGLTNYLNEMAFGAAQSSDLWRNIQKALDASSNPSLLQGQTVAEIMEAWSTQAGFPVVTVRRTASTIFLTQERCLSTSPTNNYDTLWPIPINYATASNPDFESTTATYWLHDMIENTGIVVSDNDWIILNKQQTGYYRVNYDLASWDLIIDYLNTDNYNKIHVLNRAQLIDDSFNLARSGRINYGIPLRLSLYLSRETEYVPIYSYITMLSTLNNYVSGSEELYPLFKKYVKEILQAGYKYVGNDLTGTHLDTRNRLNLINWLCKFEDEACMEAMHLKFTQYNRVDPDLQSAVYCGGLRLNVDSDKKWDYAYQQYHAAEESSERSRWLTALGCTMNTTYLERVLYMGADYTANYILRSGDRMNAFSAVYTSSQLGLDYAFDFIIYDFILIRQTLTTSQVSSLFNGIASRVYSKQKLEKLQEFISNQNADTVSTYGTIFNRAVNTIQSNIDVLETVEETIGAFLRENFGDVTTESTTETTTESTTQSTTESTTESTTQSTAEPSTENPETTTKDPGDGASFITLSLPLLFGVISLAFLA